VWSHKKVCISHFYFYFKFLYIEPDDGPEGPQHVTCMKNTHFLLCSIWLFITLNTLPLFAAINEKHTVWCKSMLHPLTLAAQLTFHTWLRCGNTAVMNNCSYRYQQSFCYCMFENNLVTFIPKFSDVWYYWLPKNLKYFYQFFLKKMVILGILWVRMRILNDWHGKIMHPIYDTLCAADFLAVEEMKDNCLNVTHMGARLEVSLYWYWPLQQCHYCCLVF